ncbi:MAG TPA: PKD domain-containing protein [Gemmataceae bacterium]|nr:PKD domain-containing protein [Gemmataceae bacterium]
MFASSRQLARLRKALGLQFPLTFPTQLPQRYPLRIERLEDRLAPAAWNPIGPGPILGGQTPGNDPVSGRIATLVADPTDANTVYIGAAGGGVWKTSNGGTTWTPLTDTQSTLFMGSLAILPGSDINHRILYAGTGEANFSGDSSYGRGVLVSRDSGATWTLTGNSVFNQRSIGSVVIDPTDTTGDTAYAAVSGNPTNGATFAGNYGIWKTMDGGANWTNTTANIVSPFFSPFTSLVMDPGNHSVLYAAVGTTNGSTANGVYETTNGGTTWTPLTGFPGGTGTGRIVLTLADVGASTTLYASVSDPKSATFGNTLEILKSTDGGTTWNPVMAESPQSTNYVNYMAGQGWYDQTLILDPSDPTGNTVYAEGQVPLLKTTDGGMTWTDISAGADGHGPHTDHHGIGFDHNGRLLDGNDGGIWRLDSATVGNIHWTDLNGNLQITQFYGIALHPTNATSAFGGSQDNGTEVYSGSQSWKFVLGGDGAFVHVDPNHPQHVYAVFQSTVSGFFLRSDDGGSTFHAKVSGIQGAASAPFFTHYALDPANSNRLVLGTDFVSETLNNGDSWSPIGSPNVSGFNPAGKPIGAIATLGNVVYAATSDGHVWTTTNDGGSWTQSNPIASFTRIFNANFNPYFDLEVDPGDSTGETAYIVTSEFSEAIDGTTSGHNHVFRTTNAGGSWTDISGNLPDLPTWSIAIDHANSTLYIGNDNGVYVSTDGGNSWSVFGTGMPNVQVISLQYNAGLHLLGAGTHGRGMFEISTQASATPPVVTPPGSQIVTEGTTSSFNLGSFADTSNGPWMATINWGDGSSNTTFNPSGPGTLGNQPHAYTEEGTYTVTITVTNTSDTLFGTAMSQVTVSELMLNLVDMPASPSPTAGAPSSIALAAFTDPGGAETNDGTHYSASINWGDNTPVTVGTITLVNGIFTVGGTHTYAAANSYTVSVMMNHEGGATPVQTGVTVASLGQFVQAGLIKPISFWAGLQGQELLRRFGPTSGNQSLGQWLATTYPNLYGGGNGAPNLSPFSNAQISSYYLSLFLVSKGVGLDAEVLATALEVFTTTLSLGGTTGQATGFTVNSNGLGAYSWNIGASGQAFGVTNNTVLDVYQILLAANNSAAGGEPWDSNVLFRNQGLSVFMAINNV